MFIQGRNRFVSGTTGGTSIIYPRRRSVSRRRPRTTPVSIPTIVFVRFQGYCEKGHGWCVSIIYPRRQVATGECHQERRGDHPVVHFQFRIFTNCLICDFLRSKWLQALVIGFDFLHRSWPQVAPLPYFFSNSHQCIVQCVDWRVDQWPSRAVRVITNMFIDSTIYHNLPHHR